MLDDPIPETKQMSDIPILKDKAQHVPADFRGTSREGPTAFARNTLHPHVVPFRNGLRIPEGKTGHPGPLFPRQGGHPSPFPFPASAAIQSEAAARSGKEASADGE